MFADITDGIWQHLTCPAILGLTMFMIGKQVQTLKVSIDALAAGIARHFGEQPPTPPSAPPAM